MLYIAILDYRLYALNEEKLFIKHKIKKRNLAYTKKYL